MVWQLQLARHQLATPLTRDYMMSDKSPGEFTRRATLPTAPTLSRSLGE
jgi:hypothetical protein